MRFEPTEPFVPAPGHRSAHAQTVFASLFRSTRTPEVRRTRLELPDGDFVDLDTLEGPPGRPHVIALHGLEGSSRAGYIASLLRGAKERGWGATAVNFRSCSGEPNRLARSYHSGDTGDVREVVAWLGQRHAGPLFAVGFSLGANVLCRFLEEDGDASPLRAAASVSAPYDLSACADALDASGGFQPIYRTRFLRSLKAKAREKALCWPGSIDLVRVRAARTVRAFDDAVSAPLHGFRNAEHYYAEASSGPHLGRIRRPTLLLSASDDPIIPPPSIPGAAGDNASLSVVLTSHGGHVGFVSGSLWKPRFWAEEQVLAFFERARLP